MFRHTILGRTLARVGYPTNLKQKARILRYSIRHPKDAHLVPAKTLRCCVVACGKQPGDCLARVSVKSKPECARTVQVSEPNMVKMNWLKLNSKKERKKGEHVNSRWQRMRKVSVHPPENMLELLSLLF